MTDQELLDLLHRGLHQVTSRTFPPLSKEDNVQELGVDSLELLELVSWAEEQTGHRVPDAKLFTVATVGDLCGALGTVPDRDAVPDLSSAPDRSTVPALDTVPGQSTAPDRSTAPALDTVPDRVASP